MAVMNTIGAVSLIAFAIASAAAMMLGVAASDSHWRPRSRAAKHAHPYAGRCAHDHATWRTRCTGCGHRLWDEITHYGYTEMVAPRPTRRMPPWRWPGELYGRCQARHADVAVPEVPPGRPPAEAAAPESAWPSAWDDVPWDEVPEPEGWPVFATCADIEPITDGPAPARPYVLREYEYREAR